MQRQIEQADFVLVVCTEVYQLRFSGGEEEGVGQGATWEGAIITSTLFNSGMRNVKFIPVFFAATEIQFIPVPLQTTTYYGLNEEKGYVQLYRRLTDQPSTPPPPLGTVISLAEAPRKQLFTTIDPESESGAPPVSAPGLSDVDLVKQYLPRSQARIDLDSLLNERASALRGQLLDQRFSVERPTPTAEGIRERLAEYESACRDLCAVMSVGCYYGDHDQEVLWTRLLETILNPVYPQPGHFYDIWHGLRRYPALLLLYSGGVAALLAGRHGNLRALMLDAKLYAAPPLPAASVLNVHKIGFESTDQQKKVLETRAAVPMSDRAFVYVQDVLGDLVHVPGQLQTIFDRFEYLLALVHADLDEDRAPYFWTPVGAFIGRGRYGRVELPGVAVGTAIETAGEKWPPLLNGFFGGSLEHALTLKTQVDDWLQKHTPSFWD